jgi:hypothetical protein
LREFVPSQTGLASGRANIKNTTPRLGSPMTLGTVRGHPLKAWFVF